MASHVISNAGGIPAPQRHSRFSARNTATATSTTQGSGEGPVPQVPERHPERPAPQHGPHGLKDDSIITSTGTQGSEDQAVPPAPEADEEQATGPGAGGGQASGSVPPAAPPAAPACPPGTSPRELMWRVDKRVMPCIVILYMLAFLDRVNIGNAKSFKLAEDLGLQGRDFNTALTVFFVPYILGEIPSNIFVNRFTPRKWLSLCGIGFSAITLFQGFVQNFSGLLATRFFLGLVEAGMFPGCFYLMGMWYTRYEAQKRFTFFFNSTTLAGALGGLLASGLGKMQGLNNYNGWRWIFIVEGFTGVIICGIFLLIFPQFPEKTGWLKPLERRYIQDRLVHAQNNVGTGADRPITPRDVYNVLTSDWKIWLTGFMYMGLIVPAYGYAFFSPTIVTGQRNLDPVIAQLWSVIPWAAAFAAGMLVAWMSDKLRRRLAFATLPLAFTIIGLAMLMADMGNGAMQFFMLNLVCVGTFSAMPVVVCWANMNLAGHHRRSIGSAFQIGFGNIGGFISTYAFVEDPVSGYYKGYATCLGMVAMSVLASCGYWYLCWSENRRRANNVANNVVQMLTAQERAEKGDLVDEFRYML